MLTRGKVEREELAYLAGFFDGEGSISLAYNKVGYMFVMCSIGNTDEASLVRFQQLFGGRLYIERPRKLSKKTIYRWQLRSQQETNAFLSLIVPFLKVKQEQGWIALEFQSIYQAHNTPRVVKETYRARLQAARTIPPAETKRESEATPRCDSPTLVETPVC